MPLRAPKPLLLLVDDTPDNLDLLVNYLEDAGMDLSVALNGREALKLARSEKPDLILLDVMMPGMDGFETCRALKKDAETRSVPVLFMSALNDTIDKIKGFEAGGVDYLTKPLQQAEVLARVNAHLTIRRQHRELENKNQELQELNTQLQAEITRRNAAESNLKKVDAKLSALSAQEAERWGLNAFVGEDVSVLRVLEEIRRLQRADKTNVLILGESGTGKELVARALHFGGPRAKEPFIAVNCAAVPADLADAEFFGHLKGAFTGALDKRKGYFEQAHGGTLFLDEIGDMSPALQAKLLRVLENQSLTPLGGSREKRVNVRVLAATNVDLEKHITDKIFRRDLYFRLAAYTVHLPPLRERKQDIPLLVEHFLEQLSAEMGRPQSGVTSEALRTLLEYDYPGNIRELKNLIEYALISSNGAPIRVRHLRFMSAAVPVPPPSTTSPPPLIDRESDEERVLSYLRKHPRINNIQCRQLLGVSHHRASYLLKKLHKEGRLQKEGERRWAFYRLL